MGLSIASPANLGSPNRSLSGLDRIAMIKSPWPMGTLVRVLFLMDALGISCKYHIFESKSHGNFWILGGTAADLISDDLPVLVLISCPSLQVHKHWSRRCWLYTWLELRYLSRSLSLLDFTSTRSSHIHDFEDNLSNVKALDSGLAYEAFGKASLDNWKAEQLARRTKLHCVASQK